MAVVDLVQRGVLLLLPSLNLSDVLLPSPVIGPTCWGIPLAQVRELLANLLSRQDAPDRSPYCVWIALALPALWVLRRRCRVGVMPHRTVRRGG